MNKIAVVKENSFATYIPGGRVMRNVEGQLIEIVPAAPAKSTEKIIIADQKNEPTPNELIGHGIYLFKNKVDKCVVETPGFNAQNASELVKMFAVLRPVVIDIVEDRFSMKSVGLDKDGAMTPIGIETPQKFQMLKQFIHKHGYEKQSVDELFPTGTNPKIRSTVENLSKEYTAITTREENKPPLLILVKNKQVQAFEQIMQKKISDHASTNDKEGQVVLISTDTPKQAVQQETSLVKSINAEVLFSNNTPVKRQELLSGPKETAPTIQSISQPEEKETSTTASQNVIYPVLNAFDTIKASSFTKDVREKLLTKFKKFTREWAFAKSVINAWNLVVNNKEKIQNNKLVEQAVNKRNFEKFKITMSNLFPSEQKSALVKYWQGFKYTVGMLVKRFTSVPDPKVTQYEKKKEEPVVKALQNTVIVNGQVITRQETPKNEKIVDMQEWKKEHKKEDKDNNVIDFYKKIEKNTVSNSVREISQKGNRTEPQPEKVLNFFEKTKQKTSNMWKKAVSWFSNAA